MRAGWRRRPTHNAAGTRSITSRPRGEPLLPPVEHPPLLCCSIDVPPPESEDVGEGGGVGTSTQTPGGVWSHRWFEPVQAVSQQRPSTQ